MVEFTAWKQSGWRIVVPICFVCAFTCDHLGCKWKDLKDIACDSFDSYILFPAVSCKIRIPWYKSVVFLLSSVSMRWVFVAERQGQKYWWAKCVIAAVSIVVLISVSLWLCEQKGKMCKMLDYLGNHSMEVYIIHAPILILGRNVLSKLIGNVWIYSYFIHNCNYPFIVDR